MQVQIVVAESSLTNRDRDELAEWLVQSPMLTEDPLRWWIANQKLYPVFLEWPSTSIWPLVSFFNDITSIILTKLSSNGCG